VIIEFENEVMQKMIPLERHKLFSKIQSGGDLRSFMERHVYAVFDFMSLAKALQNEFAPCSGVWTMPKSNKMARFINEIILCEESDELPSGEYMSHFEMYCMAMDEVHADKTSAMSFMKAVNASGVSTALREATMPNSSRNFLKSTFEVLERGKIHEIAAFFCFGREKCIPLMFQSLLDDMKISESDAPIFYHYLKRHIEVDGDSHGPLALEMMEFICGTDDQMWEESKSAAISAIDCRIAFWDEVAEEIKK
tara:strand:+ start:248295 stop:249050 length:756 start_codon:yes stop_codon:yes gene_type:complete